MTSRDFALRALDAALEKKALEPVLLEVGAQSSYTDFILLVSGRSDRQVQHIADGIQEALAQEPRLRTIGVEGQREGHWILLDFGQIIVHVFHHPLREMYDLEGLWVDARRVEIEVPEEARAGQIY